jgi:hypothetical protein
VIPPLGKVRLLQLGRSQGTRAQFVTEQAVYAQRPFSDRSAATAASQQPAAGYGAPSALQGPVHAERRGQPIFRRYSSY